MFGDSGDEWAVITGASEGIGRSYAIDLARAGYNIKLVSRSREKLEKVKGEIAVAAPSSKVKVVPLDVTKATNGDFAGLFDQQTSIMVNNAGFLRLKEDFIQQDPQELQQMLDKTPHNAVSCCYTCCN